MDASARVRGRDCEARINRLDPRTGKGLRFVLAELGPLRPREVERAKDQCRVEPPTVELGGIRPDIDCGALRAFTEERGPERSRLGPLSDILANIKRHPTTSTESRNSFRFRYDPLYGRRLCCTWT